MTLKEKISALEKELEELKAQVEKEEDKIKVGEDFCYVLPNGQISTPTFGNTLYDNELIEAYNIFKKDEFTEKHLEWYANNVIKVHNRLMQLHEQLCPNYFPDWGNINTGKCIVYFNTISNKWDTDFYFNTNYFNIYFPSMEVAQTACEILNKEKFMFKEEE